MKRALLFLALAACSGKIDIDAEDSGAPDAIADANGQDGGGKDAQLPDADTFDVEVFDATDPIDVTIGDAGLPDTAMLPDGGCNGIVNQASPVTIMHSQQSPPSMSGGNTVNGVYYMTTATLYDGMSGSTGQSIAVELVVSNGVISSVATQQNSSSHGTYNFSTNSASFTLTPTCGGGNATTGTYTATSQTLDLQMTQQNLTIAYAFTRQ